MHPDGPARPPASGDLNHALRYGPFDRALAVAIQRRGLSLARLCAHLESQGVTTAQSTLSYWQRGLRHPGLPRALETVRALERVLDLPRDSLVVLAGPLRREAGAERRVRPVRELSESWARTGALLGEFDGVSGNPCNSDLELVTVFDDLRISAAGAIEEITATMAVRALRSGPDGFVVVHQYEPEGDIDTASLRTGEGCRVGRVRKERTSVGMVFELLFDRKLTEDDVHVFSFSLELNEPVRSATYVRMIRDRVRAYLVRLHFDPSRLPLRCTQVQRAREGLAPMVDQPLLCGPNGYACAYFEEPEASLAGVEFLWE